MPRNIEIKARIDSVAARLPVARALADGDAEVIDRDDRAGRDVAAPIMQRLGRSAAPCIAGAYVDLLNAR